MANALMLETLGIDWFAFRSNRLIKNWSESEKAAHPLRSALPRLVWLGGTEALTIEAHVRNLPSRAGSFLSSHHLLSPPPSPPPSPPHDLNLSFLRGLNILSRSISFTHLADYRPLLRTPTSSRIQRSPCLPADPYTASSGHISGTPSAEIDNSNNNTIKVAMESISAILARGNNLLSGRDSQSSSLTPITLNLIIAFIVLTFVGLLLVGALYTIRKIRKSRAVAGQGLPQYNEHYGNPSNHNRLTITTSPYGRASSIFVYDEKSSILKNSASPPLSPDNVPEIRITFPDEQDESGRRTSGRVVVVRVGEKGGVGLEPLRDEQLPAYEKETGDRFHSIDMERIGGLKEKPSWQ